MPLTDASSPPMLRLWEHCVDTWTWDPFDDGSTDQWGQFHLYTQLAWEMVEDKRPWQKPPPGRAWQFMRDFLYRLLDDDLLPPERRPWAERCFHELQGSLTRDDRYWHWRPTYLNRPTPAIQPIEDNQPTSTQPIEDN